MSWYTFLGTNFDRKTLTMSFCKKRCFNKIDIIFLFSRYRANETKKDTDGRRQKKKRKMKNRKTSLARKLRKTRISHQKTKFFSRNCEVVCAKKDRLGQDGPRKMLSHFRASSRGAYILFLSNAMHDISFSFNWPFRYPHNPSCAFLVHTCTHRGQRRKRR